MFNGTIQEDPVQTIVLKVHSEEKAQPCKLGHLIIPQDELFRGIFGEFSGWDGAGGGKAFRVKAVGLS
jgi:hypothetical protein